LDNPIGVEIFGIFEIETNRVPCSQSNLLISK
jgi:hypothetical protein